MKSKIILAITYFLFATSSSFAAISFVKVQAGGSNVPQNFSNRLAVSNNRIQGFRLPFITGVNHTVDFTGTLLSVSDRVEICDAGGTVKRTLTGSALNKFTTAGENHLKFAVNSSDLPAIDESFIIRVKYIAFPGVIDQLDCKVAGRGVINFIQWIGTNVPVVTSNINPSGESSILKIGVSYTIQFKGTGFTNSVQLFDGLQSNLFRKSQLPFVNSNLTVDAAGTIMTLQVTATGISNTNVDLENFSDPTKNLLFAFGGVGNISGGWGPYLYFDYNNNIGNALDLTDLKRIESAPVSTFFPELQILQVDNKFLTNGSQGSQFSDKDLANFQLCNTSNNANVKVTTIPDMKIIIENKGNVASPQTTLRVLDINGVQITSIIVSSISAKNSRTVTYKRAQSNVCGQGTEILPLSTNIAVNRGTCVRCTDVASGNLPLWTDSGLILDITTVPNEQITTNNRLVIN